MPRFRQGELILLKHNNKSILAPVIAVRSDNVHTSYLIKINNTSVWLNEKKIKK